MKNSQKRTPKNHKEMGENFQAQKVEPVRKPAEHCQLCCDQKRAFYRILKRLLANPWSLQEDEWAEEHLRYEKQTCRLVYGKKSCEFSVLDEKRNVLKSGVVATLDIYLRWRNGEPEECVSLANLQRVQNQLTFLGIHSTEVNACFFLAKHELIKEPFCRVRDDCKLQIVCDEVILAFRSGSGENEITVLYDDQKNTAMCHIAVWENGQRTDEIRSG